MANFRVPPAREPLIVQDASGSWICSRTWFLFFENVSKALGGGAFNPDDFSQDPGGVSFDPLSATADQALFQLPTNEGLLAIVTEMQKSIQGLEQR